LSFVEATRKRAFNLVARAYSCIKDEEFSRFIGLPIAEATEGKCQQWLNLKQIGLFVNALLF
jgi:hypothetical protein